jgi:hypothetical protein
MTQATDYAFTSDPSAGLLKNLTIRVADPEDYAAADAAFDREHYLGKVKRSGEGLLQVVEHQGRTVAFLDWGPGALKLADRDEWIGWNGRQRADRRALVVNNRRFLVLSATRMPNLASRCLSMGLKSLPGQWAKRFGYKPLLAETFTDIEQFEGTCYKASNWIAVGLTKGFKRHRADYYQHHGRPKKLWLYPLHPRCQELLQSIRLPADYAKAVNEQSPERDLPLKKKQLESLREVLVRVPDPRKSNRSFPISSLLSLVAMGLLAGCTSLAEIQRYGQFLTHTQRVWIGWPTDKNGKSRKAPSYSALYNLLGKLDAHAYARALSEWMQDYLGELPRALALDGKYVRDQVLTLCLSDHETGAPAAVALADEKPRTEDNKTDGEITVSKKLYRKTPLHDAVITCDALHDKQPIAQLIVEQGGDYFQQSKDPRRAPMKTAEKLDGTPTPFLPAPLTKAMADMK